MYSSSFGDRTYLKMFALGQAALKRGRNVIFDASFALKKYRTWLKRLAKRNQVNFLFIETTAPDSVIIKRLKQRRRDVSDAGPKLLAKFKKYYQPPNELPALRLPG
jgi:predicted kinase